MNRRLLITDCDEVLLHMVSHFDAWLEEAHGIRFAFETGTVSVQTTTAGVAAPGTDLPPWDNDYTRTSGFLGSQVY